MSSGKFVYQVKLNTFGECALADVASKWLSEVLNAFQVEPLVDGDGQLFHVVEVQVDVSAIDQV